MNGIRYLVGFLRGGIEFVASKRELFGDVYRVQFINGARVVIWDADLLHQIVQNNDKAWSTALAWNVAMFDRLDPRGGNVGTLLSLDFEDHRAARKLVQPAFTMKAIDGYLAIAARAFDEAIPRWVAAGRVDFKREVRTLLAAV